MLSTAELFWLIKLIISWKKERTFRKKKKMLMSARIVKLFLKILIKTGNRVQSVRRMIVCRNRRWAASFAWKVPIYTRSKWFQIFNLKNVMKIKIPVRSYCIVPLKWISFWANQSAGKNLNVNQSEGLDKEAILLYIPLKSAQSANCGAPSLAFYTCYLWLVFSTAVLDLRI